MIAYKKGMVVLVPFPFSDQTTTKRRPAVIISSDSYNNISSDIIIMAITSQASRTDGIGECLIEDWEAAGLIKPSVIKPAISTIEQSLVLKRLGQFSIKDIFSMEEVLRQLLELK